MFLLLQTAAVNSLKNSLNMGNERHGNPIKIGILGTLFEGLYFISLHCNPLVNTFLDFIH